MKSLYAECKRMKIQTVNIGISAFSLSLWLYSIFPLFIPYPVTCFIALASLSLICLFFHCYRKEGLCVYQSTLIWTWVIFPLMISNINSFDIYACADMLIYLLAVLFIVFCCRTINEYDASINLLKILSGLYIISIYIQYLNKDLFERLFLDRFDSASLFYYQSPYMIGMGGSPGVATTNCTIALAILISFKKDCKFKTYMVKMPYMLIILIAYFLIGKKSGLLSAAFGMMVIYLIGKKRKLWKRIITLLTGILILCGIIYCIVTLYGNLHISLRIKEGLRQVLEGRDFSSGRIALYKAAWDEFLQHPLLGIGWKTFSVKHGNLVHNIYLQLLCETGLIGFMLFIVPIANLYIKTCKMIIHCRKELISFKLMNYLIFSLYIQSEFLFISLFENNLYMTMPLYLYFFACSIAITAKHHFVEEWCCHKRPVWKTLN